MWRYGNGEDQAKKDRYVEDKLIEARLASIQSAVAPIENPEKMDRYSRNAPVTKRSDKRGSVHWRWQCRTCLRQRSAGYAARVTNTSLLAGADYRLPTATSQKATPSGYRAGIAFQMDTDRVYRSWQTSTPDDTSLYLHA